VSSILNKIYCPAEYVAFNEGVSRVLFPHNRFLRNLAGCKFTSWLFWDVFRKYEIVLGERLYEIPTFWTYFANISAKVKRVLDFGCCDSKTALHLCTLGYDVTGVDLRDYEYDKLLPNFTFIKGDIFSNSGMRGGFDLIVAVSAIEHVGLKAYGGPQGRDDKELVRLFSRLLNPNGYIFVSVPYGAIYEEKEWLRVYDDRRLNELFEFDFKLLRKDVFTYPDNRHWKGYSEKVWCGLWQKKY
jgi:SAM-dependent methyltransferase